MSMEHRKSNFVQLAQTIGYLGRDKAWPGFESGLTADEFDACQQVISTHYQSNGWFVEKSVRQALLAWSDAMTSENMDRWLSQYSFTVENPKSIAIICAGNIPLVGWHDVLCVLLSGHKAQIKLSSDDALLIPMLLRILVQINPEFEGSFEIVTTKLTGFEAVIATGSNNTARHFEYYFRDVPRIIRKSRTSVAILNGNESPEELSLLCRDIFDYFGLGCRNVCHLLIPKEYDLNTFFGAIYPEHAIINHNKYANNYDYNKAVWLLNLEDLLDNEFILLKEDDQLSAPTGSLFYTRYANADEVNAYIARHAEQIQCVVGSGFLPFGKAQKPELWDYADGVDTMAFLSGLN
jgi:Acyl-CoA reductase (LuxC)